MIMKYRVDTVFYHIGKIIWFPVLAAGIWFAQAGYAGYGELFACSVYKLIGIPCPGCGGTRAIYYLFLGKISTSFTYHPAVIFAVMAYLHFMLLYFCRKHICKVTKDKEIHLEYYIYAAVSVILIQWIFKLIYLFGY